MLWVAVGGLAVLITMALVAVARHQGGKGADTDLGSISGSWLNERRAHERESHSDR